MLLETQHGFYEVFNFYDMKDTKKKCPNCKEVKPLDMFHRNSSKVSGYKSHCKLCSKKYRDRNSNYFKKYQKKYREENSEYFKEKSREFRKNNPEYYKKFRKTREYKTRVNTYAKKRRSDDSMFKLQGILRNRIYNFMLYNKYKKNKRTEDILGASFKEVKIYIESTFKEGMVWENNGRCSDGNCEGVWHIDHKIPLSSASTEEELYNLFHYTNLQALWALDNLSKGGR